MTCLCIGLEIGMGHFLCAKLDRVLCHDGEPPLLGYGIVLAYNVDD